MDATEQGPVLLWRVVQKMVGAKERMRIHHRVMPDNLLVGWWIRNIGPYGSVVLQERGNPAGQLSWKYIDDDGVSVWGDIHRATALMLTHIYGGVTTTGKVSRERLLIELRRMLKVRSAHPRKKKENNQLPLF